MEAPKAMATEKKKAAAMTHKTLLCTAQSALLVLVCATARASGPVGPVGPVGPIGPVGPVRSGPTVPPQAPALPGRVRQPAASAPEPAQRPSAEAGNHIEVTGNTASVNRCAGDATTSVNSVDVAGAKLEGRTVIVQGRNARDVRTQDCTDRTHPSNSASHPNAPSQTNSIRIR